MNKLEYLLNTADFSQYSDLKSRLSAKLFNEKQSSKTVSFPFQALADDDVAFLNAAQGIPLQGKDTDDDLLHN